MTDKFYLAYTQSPVDFRGPLATKEEADKEAQALGDMHNTKGFVLVAVDAFQEIQQFEKVELVEPQAVSDEVAS
jgi:hypothetical protein